MTPLAEELRKEYKRNYYYKNKERILKQQKEYREKNKEKIKEQRKAAEERYWEKKAAEKLAAEKKEHDVNEHIVLDFPEPKYETKTSQDIIRKRTISEIWSIAANFYKVFGENAYREQETFDKCVEQRLKELSKEWEVPEDELFGDKTSYDRERIWL